MRTTVTLDADTESTIRRLMSRRGVSFTRALNDAIRAGVGNRAGGEPATVVRAMGRPRVTLDRALQLAGELEDEERLREMRAGR
ncbi:MAG: antitoxin [Micrococcales bacterium]|nr:antitoxin [Micrococcales bacterium]